jgi:hypothetical protein
MRLVVKDISDRFEAFPSTGTIRLIVINEKGRDRELEFKITKLERFAKIMLSAVDVGRSANLQQGYVWKSMDEDAVGEPLNVDGFQLIPRRETGDVCIQFVVP